MKSQVVELAPTEWWEREPELETPTVTIVLEKPALTVPLSRTRHREPRSPVWHGLTHTRWGWYVLLVSTFAVSFVLTLETLAISHHVSF